MNKLDRIEEKIEKFLLRLGDIEKLVSLLRLKSISQKKSKQSYNVLLMKLRTVSTVLKEELKHWSLNHTIV